MPYPFDQIDTLQAGFFASIIVHCLKEGIIPPPISKRGNLNLPLLIENTSP